MSGSSSVSLSHTQKFQREKIKDRRALSSPTATLSRGNSGKSFQVNWIEVSAPSGWNVYSFLSEKESDTDRENRRPAGRQTYVHTGRVQEEKQAVEPSQGLWREHTAKNNQTSERDGNRSTECSQTHARTQNTDTDKAYLKPCTNIT